MATLKSPFDGGVVDVPDELADRYTAAGWLEDAPKRQTRAKRTEDDN
ncbi:hypothetical protein [Cellulomonas sp. KH9]|nr:hypothetical protein [Cellulomonas sp. KH9]SFK31609.1 hypothetical protein SAMN05216467_2850 [Cellulomonas sp. KH9]